MMNSIGPLLKNHSNVVEVAAISSHQPPTALNERGGAVAEGLQVSSTEAEDRYVVI